MRSFLLGAKTVEGSFNIPFKVERGKTTPTARDYVQSGAIAMFDGIENESFGVHGQSLNDITGNHAMTVNRGRPVVNDDSIYFDGNTYMSAPSGEDTVDAINNMNLTMEFCGAIYKQSTWNVIFTPSWYLDGRSGSFKCGIWYTDSSYTISSTQYGATNNFTKSYKVPFGERVSFSVVISDNGHIDWYLSGKKVASGDGAEKTYGSTGGQYMLVGLGNSAFGKFDLCGLRMYNRPLSEVEVLKNHSVDRARYNVIPK